MLCTQHVLPMFSQYSPPCSELGISMYWTGNSMNNLLSYCGLVDAKIRASDIDLQVQYMKIPSSEHGENMGKTCSPHVLPMF